MDTQAHHYHSKSRSYQPEICASLMRQLNDSDQHALPPLGRKTVAPAPEKRRLEQPKLLEQPVNYGITCGEDIRTVRRAASDLADMIGFPANHRCLVATAVSELAHNIYKYAGTGKITLCKIWIDVFPGVFVVAEDHGPGISDVRLALSEGYSSCGRLGLGLTGVYRASDIFVLDSWPGKGTQVCIVFFVPEGCGVQRADGGRRR